MNAAEPIRAPHGAVAWTPSTGWLHEPHEVPQHVANGDVVLVVSDDGMVHGVQPHDRAPLVAVLRVEADLDDLVQRLGDVADHAAGLDVSEATDVAALHTRVTALAHRVARLEGHAP